MQTSYMLVVYQSLQVDKQVISIATRVLYFFATIRGACFYYPIERYAKACSITACKQYSDYER
jgi:hypothetical protein